jgi:2-oxo-4-hydroxy-4-carboxy--5-ureidoimidazoline (OHCU) decarboxylase
MHGFGGLLGYSPWVAEKGWNGMPFATLDRSCAKHMDKLFQETGRQP